MFKLHHTSAWSTNLNVGDPHPSLLWWQHSKTWCTAWRCNTHVLLRRSCKSSVLSCGKTHVQEQRHMFILSVNVHLSASNLNKNSLSVIETTLLHKTNLKFHLKSSSLEMAVRPSGINTDCVVHTSTYCSSGSLWRIGGQESHIFAKWVFLLKKINRLMQEHLTFQINFLQRQKCYHHRYCRAVGMVKHNERHLQHGEQPRSNTDQQEEMSKVLSEEEMNKALSGANSMTSLRRP